MKKVKMTLAITVIAVLVAGGFAFAKKNDCATIKGGTIRASDGSLIETGYDDWGYNYQAHMFNGSWCDYHPVYRLGGANYDWCLVNMSEVELSMKWSDEWMSNKDCNDDEKLDRGYSCNPVVANNSGCPGAWLTNHEKGSYIGTNDEDCHYTYFCKIVAVPTGAYMGLEVDGENPANWYSIDGVEIGPAIWGAFATIQEVYNDSCTGEHGLQYKSPVGPGFGIYKP